MARATYRLANDLPPGWFRADLFRSLERPLAYLGVRIILGRPGSVSGLVGFDDLMTSTDCGTLADDVERLVAATIAAGRVTSFDWKSVGGATVLNAAQVTYVFRL